MIVAYLLVVFAIAGITASDVSHDRLHGSNPENHRNHDRFPPLGYHGPDYYIRPQKSRPGADYRPTSSGPEQDSRPLFSRPGESYEPQGSIPNRNYTTESSQEPGQNSRHPFLRPLFSRPVENVRPQNSRPNEYTRPLSDNPDTTYIPSSFQPDILVFGSSSDSEPPNKSSGSSEISSVRPEENSSDAQTEGVEDSTLSGSAETTTKIPRRDSTYRIVYTASCPCQFTRQYEPVCGTDGQTYGNIGVLQCNQKCGSGVKMFLVGSCGRNNGHAGAISLKY